MSTTVAHRSFVVVHGDTPRGIIFVPHGFAGAVIFVGCRTAACSGEGLECCPYMWKIPLSKVSIV